jgi:hypothetical protein
VASAVEDSQQTLRDSNTDKRDMTAVNPAGKDAAEQSDYEATYADWKTNSAGWWERAAEGILWERRWDRLFDADQGPYGRWFVGGRLNACYNCVDLPNHLNLRGPCDYPSPDCPRSAQSAPVGHFELPTLSATDVRCRLSHRPEMRTPIITTIKP